MYGDAEKKGRDFDILIVLLKAVRGQVSLRAAARMSKFQLTVRLYTKQA